jgi:hypothetical protein
VLLPDSCTRCARARELAGALPFERIGALFYTALLALESATPAAVAPLLAAAAGAHATLLRTLAREKILCVPCALTALSAFAALALTAVRTPWPIALVLAVAGALTTAYLLPWSRRVERASSMLAAREVALAWLREASPVPAGQVRVVVWKRKGCPACLVYEAVLRPALEQDYAGTVVVDEIDADALPIGTPLILVAGGARILFVSLPGNGDDYTLLQRAVEAASAPSALADLGALAIVG